MQLRKVILVLGGALTAWACGAAEGDDPALFEDPGSVEQGIMKGFPGAVNGQYNYCYNPSALCVSGEGDCNSNAQCVAGLICGQDNGAKFGFAAGSDVCIPSYCQNKKLDAAQGETQIDCGGPCGTVCPTVVCPPNPNWNVVSLYSPATQTLSVLARPDWLVMTDARESGSYRFVMAAAPEQCGAAPTPTP